MKETFGSKFTALRKQKGFTQESIAAQLNVSSQAVSKWENDSSFPDVTLLPKIAALLGTTTDFLLGSKITPLVEVAPKSKRDINKLVFRVNVLSKDGDRVKINLPMPIVMAALDSDIKPKVNGKDIFSNIDPKTLLEWVEQGILGKMVEIDTKDGDKVEITIE